MKESEIEYIMEQMQGRGLSYYKMELNKNSYRFTPVKIRDKFADAENMSQMLWTIILMT